jgi:hypothetical protein
LEQVLGVKLLGPGTQAAEKKNAPQKRIAAAGAKKSGIGKTVLPRRRALLVEEVDQTKWIKEIVGNGGYRNAPRSFASILNKRAKAINNILKTPTVIN